MTEEINASKSSLEIREENYKVERAIRAFAWLLWFDAAIMLFIGSVFLEDGPLFFIGLICLIVGFVKIIIGYGLNKLKPWVKTPAIIVSGIGMISFPIGTFIGGCIWYLMYQKKTKVILSENYKKIIQETPEINSTPSIILRGIVVLVILALVVQEIAVIIEQLI